MADDKNQRENMLVVEDLPKRLQADTQTLDVLPPQVLRLRKSRRSSSPLYLDFTQQSG